MITYTPEFTPDDDGFDKVIHHVHIPFHFTPYECPTPAFLSRWEALGCPPHPPTGPGTNWENRDLDNDYEKRT